jgi:glyoxylase-like metal-dependent hydrolase (beta-lactamase superfamily II)
VEPSPGPSELACAFPEAESFAPQGCIAPLRRKAPSVPFAPLASLPLPEHVRWREAPGFTTGETLLSVRSASCAVLFVGDVLANIQRMPGPPLRWIFTLTGSAPGLRPFRLANFSFVRDKAAVREHLLSMIEAAPPTLLVPAHGSPVSSPELSEQLVAHVRAL